MHYPWEKWKDSHSKNFLHLILNHCVVYLELTECFWSIILQLKKEFSAFRWWKAGRWGSECRVWECGLRCVSFQRSLGMKQSIRWCWDALRAAPHCLLLRGPGHRPVCFCSSLVPSACCLSDTQYSVNEWWIQGGPSYENWWEPLHMLWLIHSGISFPFWWLFAETCLIRWKEWLWLEPLLLSSQAVRQWHTCVCMCAQG